MELKIPIIDNIAPVNHYQLNNTFLKQPQHLPNTYFKQQKTVGDSFSKILDDVEAKSAFSC